MGDRPSTRDEALELALDWAEGRRSNVNIFMSAEAGPENRVHTLALVAQADAAEVAKWTAIAAVLPLSEPRDADVFEGDAGAQLIRATLHGRGYDLGLVESRMVEYEAGGDLWVEFVGPMVTRVEAALGLALCEVCEEAVVDPEAKGADGRSVCDECRAREPVAVLGRCSHGVNLDRDFCALGCRV